MAHPDDEFLVRPEDLDDAIALAARRLRGIAGKKGRGGRYVRTPEGANFYGQPIGTLITADIIAAAERKHGKKAPKNSLAYNPVTSGKSAAATGSRQGALGNHLKNGPHPVEPAKKAPAVAGVKQPQVPGAPAGPAAKPNFGKPKLKPHGQKPAVQEMDNYDLDGTSIEVPKGARVIRNSNSDVAYSQSPDGGIHAYNSKGEIDLSGNKEAIKKVSQLFDADLASLPNYREESPTPKDDSKDRISADLDDISAELDSAIQSLPPEQRSRFESLRDRIETLDGSDDEREALSTEAGVDPNRPETTAPGNKVRPKVGDKADADSLNNAAPGSMVRSENPLDGGIERYTKRDDNLWYKRGDKEGYSAEELGELEPEFSSVPDSTDADAPAADAPNADAPAADLPEEDVEPVEFDQKAINAARKRADESPLWEKIADLDPNNDETTLDLTPDEMREFIDNSKDDKNLADMRDQMVQALRAHKPLEKKEAAPKSAERQSDGGGDKPPTDKSASADMPSESADKPAEKKTPAKSVAPERKPIGSDLPPEVLENIHPGSKKALTKAADLDDGDEPKKRKRPAVGTVRDEMDRKGEINPDEVDEMSYEELDALRQKVGPTPKPGTPGVKELNAQNVKRAEKYKDDPQVQKHLAEIEAHNEEWEKQLARNALNVRLRSLEQKERGEKLKAERPADEPPKRGRDRKGFGGPDKDEAPEPDGARPSKRVWTPEEVKNQLDKEAGPLGESIPKDEARRKRLQERLIDERNNTEGTHRVNDVSELDNAKEGDVFAIGKNKYVITADGKVKSLTTNNISEKDNFRKIAENGKLWKLENEQSEVPDPATLESDPEQVWIDAQKRRNLYNKKISDLLNGRLPEDMSDAEYKKYNDYLDKRNEAKDDAIAATEHMNGLDAADSPNAEEFAARQDAPDADAPDADAPDADAPDADESDVDEPADPTDLSGKSDADLQEMAKSYDDAYNGFKNEPGPNASPNDVANWHDAQGNFDNINAELNRRKKSAPEPDSGEPDDPTDLSGKSDKDLIEMRNSLAKAHNGFETEPPADADPNYIEDWYNAEGEWSNVKAELARRVKAAGNIVNETDDPTGPADAPEAPTGPANAPGGPEAPTSFADQDFHPDAEGDPNGIAYPQPAADGHSWSLEEGKGISKDWLDNAPAGSQFKIKGGKDGKEWGTFQKDVDGHWRRIDGRLGHFNPRTEGLQGNMDPGHNFNMFDEDGNLTGEYKSGKVSKLGDADYRPLHISKSYEHILPQVKDLEAMPDGVSVIVYDPANSLRVNNVPKYTQFYKKDGKWFAVTADGMVTEGIDSDRLGIEGSFLFKSSKGDDISVVPHSGDIDPGEISPRARYYARDVYDGEFSEGAVIWRIRTDKETNTTGQRTYAYRHVGTDPDTGEDLWIGQDFTTDIPVTTSMLNKSVGGEFFVDDTPRTIAQYRERRAWASGKRGHYLEDDDLSPLVNHYDAQVPDHMDYFAGDHIKQFSQLQQYEDNAVMRVVGAPGEDDYYIKKRPDGWHRIRGLGLLDEEPIQLNMDSDVYKAFKDKKRGVRFESFDDYPDATNAGINLTPDGHTASVGELRDAINAIDNHQGHHFAQAVKQIPDGNILKDPETMRAVLERAKWAHPGLSDKEAVSRYLRSLDKQQRKGLFERGGEKHVIGNPNGPRRAQGGAAGKAAYGEFTADDIDDAIRTLENSPNANAGSILAKANSPLAKLDVGSVLKARFGPENVDGKDRLKSKKQFIQFLKEEKAKIDAKGLGGVNEGKGAGNVDNRGPAIVQIPGRPDLEAPAAPEIVDWGGGPVALKEPLAPLTPRANLHHQVMLAHIGDRVRLNVPGFGSQRFQKVGPDAWILRDKSGKELGKWNDEDMSAILKRADNAPDLKDVIQVPDDGDEPYAPFNADDWDETGHKGMANKVDEGYEVTKVVSHGDNISGAVHQVRFKDGSLGVRKKLGAVKKIGRDDSPDTFEGSDIESSAEVLGSALGQLLGVPRMPAAHVRENEDGDLELFTEFKSGIGGFDAYKEGRDPTYLIRNEESGFREMLFFDVLTANEDRHPGNYMVQDADYSSPIDHGLLKFKRLRGGLNSRNKDVLQDNAHIWGPSWDAVRDDWRAKIEGAGDLFEQNGFSRDALNDILYNFDILDHTRRDFG